jgi:hypothetical protein
MKPGALDVERSELIKWYAALDKWRPSATEAEVAKGLRMARECKHPDAQWLASLFPGAEAVSSRRIVEVLLQQGDDPRALHMAWKLQGASDLLLSSAQMGYAPAQAEMSCCTGAEESFSWAEKAGSQRDRLGLYTLGNCLYRGVGCARDEARGLELLREAAELELPAAQFRFGEVAYGERDWRRYVWWGRVTSRGYGHLFCDAVSRLLPAFEKNQLGRVLYTVAPVIRAIESRLASGGIISVYDTEKWSRVTVLHDAMLSRARLAIRCWLVAGRRLGVAKDIRDMIARMMWEEAWQWGEERQAEGRTERDSGCLVS